MLPSFTSGQKGFKQNHTQFAVRISLDKKLKDQSGALHSPFFAILHHKSTEWKVNGLRGFFIQPTYREPGSLIRFPFQSRG